MYIYNLYSILSIYILDIIVIILLILITLIALIGVISYLVIISIKVKNHFYLKNNDKNEPNIGLLLNDLIKMKKEKQIK